MMSLGACGGSIFLVGYCACSGLYDSVRGMKMIAGTVAVSLFEQSYFGQ